MARDDRCEGSSHYGCACSRAHFELSEQQGKAVQEILNRYVNEELVEQRDFQDSGRLGDGDSIQKDIDYITDLAKLFD